MKHTPGPWYLDFDTISTEPRRKGGGQIAVALAGSVKEFRANARLIAAAPTMLDLLKAALELRKIEEQQGDVVNWPKWFNEVQQLIDSI